MIRISPVRVIGDDGQQLGVLPIEEALARAEEKGLDLVEVAPTARPPVGRTTGSKPRARAAAHAASKPGMRLSRRVMATVGQGR